MRRGFGILFFIYSYIAVLMAGGYGAGCERYKHAMIVYSIDAAVAGLAWLLIPIVTKRVKVTVTYKLVEKP